MTTWLLENGTTLLLTALLVLALFSIIRKMHRDRKCGNCANCPMAESCGKRS